MIFFVVWFILECVSEMVLLNVVLGMLKASRESDYWREVKVVGWNADFVDSRRSQYILGVY
jgi:hypothetical protein